MNPCPRRACLAALPLIGLTLASCHSSNQPAPLAASNPAPASTDPRMDWWRDARFGMFIHWGLYAIPAGQWGAQTDHGEWIMNTAHIPVEQYEKFQAQFNPVKFDADKWAAAAKAAGVKYIVITSKHHDGFCLFDTKYTDWNVMHTPFHRDIMKEMAEACRRQGITICWYHSIMDWHHPDYLPRRDWETRPTTNADFDRYNQYLKNQVAELLTNYGPIGVMWFDGQWEGTWTHERGLDLAAHVKKLQPDVIINNRVDKGGGAMGMTRGKEFAGDYGTPEQEIPPTGFPGVDWETCMTMNDHWGYNKTDHNFKTTEDLIRKLADIAGKGGNFLLNVGPTAEGEIPATSIERLREIGKWMDVNGESIHGTRAGPFETLPWGRCTQRTLAGSTNGAGTRLYLHVFNWPKDGRLMVPGLLSEARAAVLLSDKGHPLAVSREADAVVIALPRVAPDAIDSVIALDIDGKPDVALPPMIQADTDIFVGSHRVTITSPQKNVEPRYTLDGSDPTAVSPVAKRWVRFDHTTTVAARAFRADRAVSPVVRRTFTKVEPVAAANIGRCTSAGAEYQYFEGDWNKLPDFGKMGFIHTGYAFEFDLKPRDRETYFGCRYEGYLGVPADGVYTFFLASDDGSKLSIDGRLIVDNDGLHSLLEKSGAVALAAGFHPVTVDYFEKTGGHELQLWWAGPDRPRHKLTAANLHTEGLR